MKKLFVILSFLISLMCVSSQSWGLPDCPSTYPFNNCYGSYTWANGSKYVGEWKDNKQHGQGTLTWVDGNKYVGEFKDNKANGQGTKTWADGGKYVGEWQDNKQHGQGSETWAKGSKYVGEYKDNKRNGQGTFTWVDGNKYVGEYKDNKANGQGTKTWGNGDKYIGEWKDDHSHGQGTYNYSNGDKYVGEWKNGNKHGQGTYTFANGIIEEGIFKDNKFMYAQKIKKTEKNYAEVSKSNTSSKELDALKLKAEIEELKRKELEKRLAILESKPKTLVKIESKSEFSNKPINVNFKSITKRTDDIAVIIGNANYKKQGKDIPNVNPAYADAEGIKQYFMQAKGIKEGNIIYLKDATGSQLASVFGNDKSFKGKLFNYIKPNKSNVYIYYAGHGAPGEKGDAYLVPTDTDSQTIQFTGFQLSTLYSNLGKLPAKSVTVILEACFSGGSQSGSLISKASPIIIAPKKTAIPKNIKVIAAGSESQMASWEQDSSHSLFTKYFLKAMSGEGDTNKDGKVSDSELKEYLSDTMTYYARRYYGRDQKVQIHNGG